MEHLGQAQTDVQLQLTAQATASFPSHNQQVDDEAIKVLHCLLMTKYAFQTPKKLLDKAARASVLATKEQHKGKIARQPRKSLVRQFMHGGKGRRGTHREAVVEDLHTVVQLHVLADALVQRLRRII